MTYPHNLLSVRIFNVFGCDCIWPKRATKKLLYPYCETPLPVAYRNFSSLCTLNVTAAINCTSSTPQRYSASGVTHAPFLRDDSTGDIPHSWIQFMNSFIFAMNKFMRGDCTCVCNREAPRNQNPIGFIISIDIYICMCTYISRIFTLKTLFCYNVYYETHV